MRFMNEAQTAQESIRQHLLAGAAGLALLILGAGGWAATAEFSGAVITSGFLVVDSDVKKVQHPTGGVVTELRVRNGDDVRAGDVIVRLDDTVARANLAITTKALDEAVARKGRLEAERDGKEKVDWPADLLTRSRDAEVAALVAGEQRLFEMRVSARQGQMSQLRERVGQIEEQIQGILEQIAAKKREIQLISSELDGVRQLLEKKLIPVQRANALERDLARLEGEKGTLMSSIAQAKGKITETELQIIQIQQDFRAEVGKDLADIRSKMSELVERKVSAEDLLNRVEIRAPQDGTVHQLTVHTIGGVVAPGEAIMLVVPSADHLTVEAKITPQDRPQLHLGQQAVLRFSAFNQRTTPEIEGKISMVAADLTQDPRTGSAYYTTRISVSERDLSRLEGVKLAPGMPVEAFVQTEARTVLSYFTKPLSDQVTRAFREK
jgi:HlyD family secretion protein